MKKVNLHLRVELTSDNRYILVVSSTDGRGHFHKEGNLTYEEMKEKTQAELDSWYQEVSHEPTNSARNKTASNKSLEDLARETKVSPWMSFLQKIRRRT